MHMTSIHPPAPARSGWLNLQELNQEVVTSTMTTQTRCGLATVSLVLGILGLLSSAFCLGLLPAIPAVICGHVALTRIKRSGGVLSGSGNAVAGLVTGYLVLVLSALLALAPLVPAVNKPMLKSKMVATVDIGKRILLVQMQEASYPSATNGWPSSADFRTSTEYFNHLMESGVLDVTPSFFSAAGMASGDGGGPGRLYSEANGWCVIADLGDASAGETPFLITRNLQAGTLADLHGKVGAQLTDDRPFGRQGVVCITKSGAGFILSPDTEWRTMLGEGVFTNRILRP